MCALQTWQPANPSVTECNLCPRGDGAGVQWWRWRGRPQFFHCWTDPFKFWLHQSLSKATSGRPVSVLSLWYMLGSVGTTLNPVVRIHSALYPAGIGKWVGTVVSTSVRGEFLISDSAASADTSHEIIEICTLHRPAIFFYSGVAWSDIKLVMLLLYVMFGCYFLHYILVGNYSQNHGFCCVSGEWIRRVVVRRVRLPHIQPSGSVVSMGSQCHCRPYNPTTTSQVGSLVHTHTFFQLVPVSLSR